ncbi:DUF6838 family protein [Enterococcus sp. 2201sp1_2201st1_B8_2201SCRN_220225]|uniref:phage tail terminator family protein n=1 Tax=unclassified Enterococcus TaxID=2608891 RepID=UPI0034A46B0F
MDITAAIANQLLKIEPEATIYREQQEQSFVEPSFYVYEITATGVGEVNSYEMRKHTFCVMWIPDSRLDNPGPREQCEIMREKLLDEFQRLDNLSIGVFGKEAKTVDGALQFTFRMRYRVTPEDETPKLESLKQNGGLKNG